jgi:hypothetical protein
MSILLSILVSEVFALKREFGDMRRRSMSAAIEKTQNLRTPTYY